MPWPFSAVFSPSSAVLTANERRELTDGRRAVGGRIEAAKDVDREWEFMALGPSSSSRLPVLAAFGLRAQREESAGWGRGNGCSRKLVSVMSTTGLGCEADVVVVVQLGAELLVDLAAMVVVLVVGGAEIQGLENATCV